MTVTLDSKALLSALNRANAAVEPHKLYDALQCVRIDASDDGCVLTGFNLAHEIAIKLEAEGTCASFLVNSAMLTAWLLKVVGRSADVSLDLEDARSVWRAGGSTASLPRMNVDDWRGFGAFEAERSCICSGTALSDALSSSLVAVQEDAARAFLSGVRIEAGAIGNASVANRLVAIGTNGVMLVARDIAATGLVGAGGVIVAIKAAKAIIGLLRGIETASLSWNERRVVVETGGIRFQASVIEARYPERWRESAGADRAPHVTYDTKELSAAVAAITALAPEEGERKFRGVTLTVGASETLLNCRDSTSGVAGEDRCPHSMIDPPPRTNVTLAANQLLKIVGALDGETIQVSISPDNASPVILSVAAKPDRIGFSVPLKDAA